MNLDMSQLFIFDLLKQIYDAKAPILFLSVFLYVLYILRRLQANKHNTIDFADLICTNGYINDKKALRTGAFFLLSWVVIYQTLNNTLAEWFAFLYAGLFVSNALVDRWFRSKENIALGKEATVVRGEYELGAEDGTKSDSKTDSKVVRKTSKVPPPKTTVREVIIDDDSGASNKLVDLDGDGIDDRLQESEK